MLSLLVLAVAGVVRQLFAIALADFRFAAYAAGQRPPDLVWFQLLLHVFCASSNWNTG